MAKLVLILAQSYPHVKNVLYLIDLYINDSAEIKLLIFQNNYLYKFFSEINKEHFNNKVKIKFIPKYSTIYNNIFIKYLLIADKIFLYKYYRLTCRHIAGYTVYFFSKSFTDYGYYYLKKLHSNNKIIHIQDPGCDIYNIINGKPNSLKSLFQLIYAKLLLGKNIVYGDTGRQGFHNFFTISEKYYNKIVERIILQDERDELQSNFTLSKYALTKYSKLKVIYFDKDVVKDGLCDDLQFQNEIEKIFQIISKFVQNNLNTMCDIIYNIEHGIQIKELVEKFRLNPIILEQKNVRGIILIPTIIQSELNLNNIGRFSNNFFKFSYLF